MNNGNDQEKQEKAGNPIFILIIFVVLIAFVFYVPEIYKKYNSEISDLLGIGSKGNEETPSPVEPEPVISPVSAYYQIGSATTFKFNEITISKVLLNNGIFSLVVSVDDTFDLSTSGYYIEFFKNKESFIGRRSLLGYVTKSLPIELDVSSLPIDSTTYFVVSRIEDSAIINNMEVSSDESGLTMFTCSKGDVSYDYDFYLRKLTKVSKKISYTNTDLEEYAKVLLEYQKLEKEYNTYTGITASIVDNSTSFVFLTEFNYADVSNFTRIGDAHLYSKGLADYIVKFKMEAEGYECK